jgi:hypothetical protein
MTLEGGGGFEMNPAKVKSVSDSSCPHEPSSLSHMCSNTIFQQV